MEELHAAYQRIEELEAALRGMVGLIQMLNHNEDIPKQVRWHMFKNHRVIEAEEVLCKEVRAAREMENA